MARVVHILFVCHGNICRSPMAEFVMKDLAARRGIAPGFVIDSAATSTEEIGNGMHYGTCRVLDKNGIPYDGHIARQIKKSELSDWDLIVCMDNQNIHNAQRRLGSGAKLYKLMEFAGEDRDVADPWYTGDFDTTFDDIYAGCIGLLGYLGY